MSTEQIMPKDDTLPPPYYQINHECSRRYKRRTRCTYIVLIISGIIMMLFGVFILMILIPQEINTFRWNIKTPLSSLFDRDSTVLLISMDGFRHDYLELAERHLGPDSLPNFIRLTANGVRAMESINVYPTVTLPNHRTLITGLYPENHGVVGNSLLDEKWPNATFRIDDQESLNHAPWLTDWPEPIWVTLQKKGGYAGSVLWPLTDQFVGGDLPFQRVSQYTLLNDYEHRYAYDQRVRDILWWLNNPKFRLNLILAYFDEPDEIGHAYGPNSKHVATTIQNLDGTLGRLLDGIEKRGLTDKVDIILTADHGMSETSNTRLIQLDNYVDNSWYNYTQLSVMGFLYPASGKFEKVYKRLKNAHQYLEVYRRDEVPAYLNFNISNSRMPPLILIAKPRWKIVTNASRPYANISGDHGYVTNFSEMHPFFIASGPSFKTGETVPKVHAVDIYPLMCALLNIQPNPNNGSLERISNILKPDVANRLLNLTYWSYLWKWLTFDLRFILFVSIICVFLMVLLCSIAIIMHRKEVSDTFIRLPIDNNKKISNHNF
ncbi:Ectonucleotide pyrophosphatase/phosphodiesterase family member 5 [Schistosoma japonicum]|nr:Ectonucleotide pyrophosphatase/phosphodiesterase family member 5 [Schistosoma japonicum]